MSSVRRRNTKKKRQSRVRIQFLSLRERLFLSRKGNDYFLSRFARTIVSYLIAFERLFRTKQTKREPACSVVEQAGVPIDRVFGLSRDRKGLFYLLTLERIGFVPAENEELTVLNNLDILHIALYILNAFFDQGSQCCFCGGQFG